MALQFSTTYRNGLLTQFSTTVGQDGKIKIWTGSVPTNCAASDSGTELVEWDLAASSDWGAAASGQMTLNGLPLSATAVATGTAGYFRYYDQLISTPSAPTLSTNTTGGSLAAGTYYVQVTEVGVNGEETNASSSSSQTTTGSTSTITVTSPSSPGGSASLYRVYVSSSGSAGTFYLANGAGTALGTNYTITVMPTTTNPPSVNGTGVCHMQGTVTATGGGGDLTVDNTSIASGQTVQLTGFTLTAPGA